MFEQIEYRLNRFLFSGISGAVGAAKRIDLYEIIEMYISNNIGLTTAIKDIYDIENKGGKKSTSTNAVVLYYVYAARNSGLTLWEALSPWVPDAEVQIIRAGEVSGDHALAASLKDSIKLIESKKRIFSAVAKGVSYPIFLGAMLVLLLYQVSTNMVPQFLKIVPAEKWTGSALTLKMIADLVIGYGGPLVLGVVVLIAWVIWSMPNLSKAKLRVYLDRVPPWSIYRMLNGSTFLLNVALMLQAQISLNDTLKIMMNSANPWLRMRIAATLQHYKDGGNFGEALARAGYEFPDARAIQFLRLLSEQPKFEKKMAVFGERWLEKSVKDIQKASGVLLLVSIGAIGTFLGLVVSGIFSIQQLASTVVNH